MILLFGGQTCPDVKFHGENGALSFSPITSAPSSCVYVEVVLVSVRFLACIMGEYSTNIAALPEIFFM